MNPEDVRERDVLLFSEFRHLGSLCITGFVLENALFLGKMVPILLVMMSLTHFILISEFFVKVTVIQPAELASPQFETPF